MAAARTVLVGFGMIGAGFAADRKMARHFAYASHAQVLRDHPAFDWQAVVDPSPNARAAAEAWDIPVVVPHVEDLPTGLRPDVAVIATKPAARHQALASLNGIKLAVLEKPLGPDAEAATKLLETCADRQIGVQVNLFRRAEAASRALASGDLKARVGTPQAIFGVYGNGLRNNAVHMIDLIRMLDSEVITVRALGPARELANSPVEGDVALAFTLTLSSGVHAMLQPLDFENYREIGLDIWGTEGRLEILQEGLLMRASPVGSHRALDAGNEVACDAAAQIEGDYSNALYALYDNAAAWLAGEAELVSPGANALANERIVDALLASASQGGAEIRLSQ